MKKEDKRGQSQIITTVLIILLVLAAIIIVWTVVKKTVQESSEQVDISQFSIGLEVESVYIAENNDSMNITVHRNNGKGDLDSLVFLLYDNDTQIEHRYEYDYSEEKFNHDELETITYRMICNEIEPVLDCGGMPYGHITQIKIAFSIESGGSLTLSDEVVDGKGSFGEDDFRELVDGYSVAPTSGCLDKVEGEVCMVNNNAGICDSANRCLGAELIQNGNFDSGDTYWNVSANSGFWYFGNSEANFTSWSTTASGNLFQDLNLNTGNTYLLEYQITLWIGTSFSLTPTIAGNSLSTKNIVGIYDESFVANTANGLNISLFTNNTNVVIDSFSLKEILG